LHLFKKKKKRNKRAKKKVKVEKGNKILEGPAIAINRPIVSVKHGGIILGQRSGGDVVAVQSNLTLNRIKVTNHITNSHS